MNVAQYMQPGVVTLPPEASLSVVRETMDGHGYGLLLIVDADRTLRGFVTRAGLKEVKDWEAPVETIAHPVRFSVTPEDTLEKAALILLSNRLVLLPVVKDDRLEGVITQAELLRGFVHAMGIGQEATRFTVTVGRTDPDVYPMIDTLRAHGASLLSMVQGDGDGPHVDIVFRVQGVQDKEQLRAELEAVLRGADTE
jgi:acetoin utilization protein AcuB